MWERTNDKITSIEYRNHTDTEVVRQRLLTDGFARLRSWMAASSVAVSLRHAKVEARSEGFYLPEV